MILGMGLCCIWDRGKKNGRTVQVEGSRGRCMGTEEGQVRKDRCNCPIYRTLSFMSIV